MTHSLVCACCALKQALELHELAGTQSSFCLLQRDDRKRLGVALSHVRMRESPRP
eukprot:EC783285.1.p2 GENE.EC783285.1~~EC783285.1.p2  ORF type:complete len:55 (-),score=5.47 EC783285.1:5-169(-)